MTDHLSKTFDEELTRLRDMLSTMGNLTVEQLETALHAAERTNEALARRVIEREPQADHLEHEINNLAIRLLALRQPLATDLRRVLTSVRIANELERICDYAEGLAERLLALGTAGHERLASLINLGRFATTMVRDALQAYVETDAEKATEVWNQDKELDEMYTALFRELLSYMMEDPRRITSGTQILFMARDIERVGDRATNIAEMVRYLVSGVAVEEERPKADATKLMVTPSAL
ncbi:MAG TPA: phosphate signaling complex protein PhoU [Stellaceae bacterium]|jgi:phosphate transport system protein|nr:phosphate signaling complex protein PhoU [Stellaceae bacterium]HYM04732.1 phosphate signaling complex protein PhoU [Stellaceae bacterium]